MRVNAPFKSHSCNTFLLTVSCWGDIALFQGGSAYGLQANVGGGNFALTRLRPERQCCGRLWSRIPPRTLWSVQTKWTRGLPGGAGCCGARTSRTPANGLRRWLSLASLLQALRGSLSQPSSAASLSLVTAARPRLGRMYAGDSSPKLGQLKLRTNTLADLPSCTRYARIGAALGEEVRCPIMG